MQATAKRTALVVAAVLGITGAAWAVPTVPNVKMKQIPNTRQVLITYDLEDEDAIVTLSIETNGVAIPESAVTQLIGDVNKVVLAGAGKSIQWNAGIDWPGNVAAAAQARVTAWFTNAPPQIMVIDLSSGENAENYPLSYYTSVEALPGGLTNNIYKTDKLVMRKIIQGEFSMGANNASVAVTLTNDFYMGVFEVTQQQWYNIKGTTLAGQFTDAASRAYRAMTVVNYNHIRGEVIGAGWPGNNDVESDSFMGCLRARAKSNGFDLPTDAQWEYACRAGTDTSYNDGDWAADAAATNAWLDVLGRYKSNSGSAEGATDYTWGPEKGTAIVGSYAPNAWGLYDMHGNVSEWCLDWYEALLVGGLNPVGPGSSSEEKRILRGGGWSSTAAVCRSAYRDRRAPGSGSNRAGLRLVKNLYH